MATVVASAPSAFAPVRPRSVSVTRGRWWAIAGLAPAMVWQAAFFVIPLLLLSVYSFWRIIDYRIDRTFTLYNYQEIIENPLLFNALLLSLKVAVVVTVA